MKFSFIIPVYNGENYIARCVCNIEKIDINDYEVILINDGSTDDSGSICDNLAKKNRKIHCIHQKKQGVSAARNNGLKASRGDYVLFVDVDDTIESKKLNQLLKVLERTKELDMVIFGMSFDYYYNEKLYRREELHTPLKGIKNSKAWLQNMLNLYRANSLSPIWNKIFRRSFLIENRLYFREEMFLYEDLEYTIRCMGYCNDIFFVPEIIYHYRQSEDEGNAGQRLLRIDHLYNLVKQVENALNKLIEVREFKDEQEQIKSILVLLYLVLAREKIAVSNTKQVRQICDDYAEWYAKRNIDIPMETCGYANLLLQKKVLKLILIRKYTHIRHIIAIKVKNMRIYQKLKG